MNQEERVKAFTLRCEGKTWAEIGALMHYDEKTVSRSLRMVVNERAKRSSVRYPRLRKYIEKQYDGSIGKFAGKIGVSPYHLRRVLIHGDPAGAKLSKKIQDATNLTWEEVFSEEFMEEQGE